MKNQKNNPDQKNKPDQKNNPDKTGQRQDPQAPQGQQQRGEIKGQDQGNQRDRSSTQNTYEEDQSLGNQSLEDQRMRAGGTENRGSLEQTARQERSKPNPGAAHEHEEESEDNLEDLSLKEHEKKNKEEKK